MAILSTDAICSAIDNVTGDFVYLNGRRVLATGISAVVQGIRRRIGTISGEWFLDLDLGVRWFERDHVPATAAILGQKFDATKVDAEVRRAILSTPAVTSVLRIDVAFNGATRGCSITWQARCAFGDTPVDTLAIGA
ncbi:MAG: hypothetical protein H0X39_00865 [Actinobacteria bacterium]|nr:hypothetical protein [Actinomycetota bacterium]